MNNRYIIRVTHPLTRPGLTIETESSERYVYKVTRQLLRLVRSINKDEDFDIKDHLLQEYNGVKPCPDPSKS